MPAVLLNSSAECGEGREMSEGGEMSERGNGVEVETISAVVTDSSAGRGEGGEGEMLPAVDCIPERHENLSYLTRRYISPQFFRSSPRARNIRLACETNLALGSLGTRARAPSTHVRRS